MTLDQRLKAAERAIWMADNLLEQMDLRERLKGLRRHAANMRKEMERPDGDETWCAPTELQLSQLERGLKRHAELTVSALIQATVAVQNQLKKVDGTLEKMEETG